MRRKYTILFWASDENRFDFAVIGIFLFRHSFDSSILIEMIRFVNDDLLFYCHFIVDDMQM